MVNETQYKQQAYQQGAAEVLRISRSGREASSGLEKQMPRISLWASMSPEDQAKAAILVSQNDTFYW